METGGAGSGDAVKTGPGRVGESLNALPEGLASPSSKSDGCWAKAASASSTWRSTTRWSAISR